MENIEKKLQELLDKEAIRQIRYQFAEALDNKDWHLFETLFADEIDTDYTAWGIPVQKMEKSFLVAMFSKQAFRNAELVTEHLYSNFRITIEQDKAICVSNFLGQHYIANFEGGEEFYLRGEYTDQLVKTKQGWKLSGLKLRIFYMSGNPKILA